MFFIESFLIGIFAGIVSGAIVGLIVGLIIKFKVKTDQEKIFEINRNAMLANLLESSTMPYFRIKEIWKILETLPNFIGSKDYFMQNPLPDKECYVISEYVEFVHKLLKNFLTFSECSTFVKAQDYYIIKGYLQSSLIVGFTDNSAINKKKSIHYNYKIMKDHAFFAKKILENYPKLLYKDFVSDWTKILQDEKLLTLTGFQEREAGDVPPMYLFKSEFVFGRNNF